MEPLNKAIVITGATSGIGLAAADQFVRLGWFVIGVGRSEERAKRAENQIKQRNPDGQLVFLLADLSEQDEVKNLVFKINHELIQNGFQHLDVLINNAGAFHEYKQMTSARIEKTFAVNHLAGFILSLTLYPLLKTSGQGRIITLSSYAHRTTMLNFKQVINPTIHFGLLAYKQSKLCNILFTNEFNAMQNNVQAFAVDPGLVNTQIASKGKPGISKWVWQLHRHQGTTADVPVQTLVYLASTENINTSEGFYFRDCKPQKPSRNALRSDYAQKLWELSTRLTGLQLENT